VSIINRLRLSAHLDEAALVSLWTDATLAAKAAVHPHLERCPSCRNRFAELGSWLATIRADAVSEADEHFSAERLSAQSAQIFRRLEAAERPARVIAFPTFTQPLTSRSSSASRWVAAGAESIPEAYKLQLAEGGRLVMPVGPFSHQEMVRLTRRGDDFVRDELGSFGFVPLVSSEE